MNEFNFCKNLRGFRKLKRQTQRQLARISGVSASCISELENGVKSPTLRTIEKLSKALKITPSELLF